MFLDGMQHRLHLFSRHYKLEKCSITGEMGCILTRDVLRRMYERCSIIQGDSTGVGVARFCGCGKMEAEQKINKLFNEVG